MGAAAGAGSGLLTRSSESQTSGQGQEDRFGSQGQVTRESIPQFIRENMGNYGAMRQRMGETGVSEGDISRAVGVPQSNVYSYMNRPDYQQYSRTGQFYQPIFRPQYSPYQPGPLAYGGGYGPYGQAPYGGFYGGMGGMGGMVGMGRFGGMGGYGMPFDYASGGEIEQDTSDENETDDQGIAGLLKR